MPAHELPTDLEPGNPRSASTVSQQTLILVKHSLPVIEREIPAAEWVLSEEGQARCEWLAEQLAPYRPHVAYSSLEPKALETAQIAVRRLHIPLETAVGLHEHERRCAPFTNQADFIIQVRSFFAHPKELVFGEETADQAHRRFAGTINRLQKARTHGSWIVFAHGTVISLYVARLYKIDPFPIWQRLTLPSFITIPFPDHQQMIITTF